MKDLGKSAFNQLAFFNNHVSTYQEVLNLNKGNGPWFIRHTSVSPFCNRSIVCVRMWTSAVWCDLVILSSQKTKFRPHVFSNNEQEELGKHLTVLPLPDLHLSLSDYISLLHPTSDLYVSFLIYHISCLAQKLLSHHSMRTGSLWNRWQTEFLLGLCDVNYWASLSLRDESRAESAQLQLDI